jgi:hypothetical protein
VKAVNLLPREETKGRSLGGRDPLLLGGAVLTFAVVAGTGGAFLLAHSSNGSAKKQLSAAQVQLAQAQARERAIESSSKSKPLLPVPSVTSQEQPWRTAVASAMSTRIAFDRVLQEFERVVPSDVTVANLQMGAPGATTTSSVSAAGSTTGLFTLNGTTFSEDSVARLMSRLMLLPDLTGVSLTSSTADPQTGIVTFSVTAQVKGAGSTESTSAATSTTPATTTTGAGA